VRSAVSTAVATAFIMTRPLLSFLSTYSTKLVSRLIAMTLSERFEDQLK
jgi:hypothetical protein